MDRASLFLLPEPTALSLSLRATCLAPAQTALLVPRADCSARFPAFAFAQMMFRDPLLLVTAGQSCSRSGHRSRDLYFFLLLGLRSEGEVCHVTKTTQNGENYRICAQAKYTASVS